MGVTLVVGTQWGDEGKGKMVDILALDAVVASRYKFGGKNLSAGDVPHLMAAYQNGVGEIDAKNIQVKTISI